MTIGIPSPLWRQTTSIRAGHRILCAVSNPQQVVALLEVTNLAVHAMMHQSLLSYEWQIPVRVLALLPLYDHLPAPIRRRHIALAEGTTVSTRKVLGHRLRPYRTPFNQEDIDNIIRLTIRRPLPHLIPPDTFLPKPTSIFTTPPSHGYATLDGMTEAFSQGFSTGGRCFGYQTVPVFATDKGPTGPLRQRPIGYRWRIEPEEARIVRWIFQRYRDGHSVASLVKTLRIQYPKRPWTTMSLYTILSNPWYIGIRSFNRRNHRTGIPARYLSRSERQLDHYIDPSLRIVDQALWNEVASRRMKTGRKRRHA